MFWSTAALLFLESPSERGKEHGSITSAAQLSCVGSSVSFPTSGTKAASKGHGVQVPLEAAVCWVVAVVLKNRVLRQGEIVNLLHNVNIGVFCHIYWLCLGLPSALQSGTGKTNKQEQPKGNI